MKFPPSQLLKIAMLVLCSLLLSPDPPSLLFHLFSSPPPCCSAQLNSTSPLLHPPPPLPHPLLLCFSSPLLSTSAVLSSLLTAPPLSLFSSVRFVLWLQRLNLLAKHTKSHTCKCTQEKQNPRTFFTISWALNVFWAAFSLSESKGELCLHLCNKSMPELVFNAISEINLITQFYWQYGFHQNSIKGLTLVNHLVLIIN